MRINIVNIPFEGNLEKNIAIPACQIERIRRDGGIITINTFTGHDPFVTSFTDVRKAEHFYNSLIGQWQAE